MEELPEKILDTAVSQVLNTLKFYGIEIINMEVSEERPPVFKIQIIESKNKRELKDTLNIAYWSLWSLVYGKRTEENKDSIINLSYQIKKRGHKDESR